MDYQITNEKKKYYSIHVDKIIKIQSLIKMRYWYLNYTKNIHTLINNLFQRKTKEYVHEPTLFGDNSKENIKMLEIAFKQRQKQMKEGELAQIVIGNWFGRFGCWSFKWIRLS
jgi:predicted membrane-bound dolichyl-phosphate-mannose-protein mannosyltransferase